MQVIPDPYLAALMVLPFLAAFLAMKFILFDALLAYVEERRHAIEGARAEAGQLTLGVKGRISELEAQLAAAREEVAGRRAEARARAQAEEVRIVKGARREAEQRVDEAIASIEQARGSASQEMRQSATSLSTDIAAQVLGRAVNA